MGIGYRNSISDDALYIWFSKTGYWFTGRWGDDYDSLIKTGLFSDELEIAEIQK
jgi:vacuolar protein sorting-associated protein 13A/C